LSYHWWYHHRQGLPSSWSVTHSETVSSSLAPPTDLARPLPLLSTRGAADKSSAIRDLLVQAKRPGMISLAGGLPDASSFPTAQLAEIAHGVIARDREVLQYGPTAGDGSARAAMAVLFGQADCGEVVITSGSQQALDLISRVMIEPGDGVVTGDPEYMGALQAFRSYGARVCPISVDVDGINTNQLEHELRRGLRPKCCYVVPNFHNPTGARLSPHRRTHLHQLAGRYGFLVIEDDPYRDLFFDQTARHDEFDPELTVRLRSVSKTLAPGLRIGALAGPTWLTNAIVIAQQSVALHTRGLSQAIAAEALEAPWYRDHLGSVRARYLAKRNALGSALTTTFGSSISFDLPGGGMFLWVNFTQIADTAAWLQVCLGHDVCFVPGAAFSVERDLASHVRLSFATASIDELVEGVRRLALACS